MLFRIILLLALSSYVALSQFTVKTLPGFPGELPFKLETGYIGVGEADEVQLFYYFIESQGRPKDDALILWLTGGPGCSALSGILYEIGPFTFDYKNSTRSRPALKLNPFSWTKVANIIFLDSPVGTGFSYAKTSQAYNSSDTLSTKQTYSFLRKWLVDHPEFLDNPLYIGGDSYSGIVVPVLVQEIYNGNEAGLEPFMNIKGYSLGNPYTNSTGDLNSRIPFAHRVSLLSDELYESTKENCNGNYMEVDPNNALCVDDLQVVEQCIEKIDTANILEPKCATLSPKPNTILKWDQSSLEENPRDLLNRLPLPNGPWCREYNYLYSYIWANNKTVRKALHIREGTIKEWVRCNNSLSYAQNLATSVEVHRNLTNKICQALIYSGDHDMVIPYVGTQVWIYSLNLTVENGWEPWFVDAQVAGYTEKFSHNNYYLTFATVKGGGHTAPEYKPKQCLAMFSRWLAYYPL
uniref:Putative serine carboxypeptidase-like 18 n=1 Tax=Davidia involucrata TaxID=16924 RepID=A0A5B6ZMZ1_DAVIN